MAAAALALLAPATASAALRAGVAKVDVTPENGGTTLGFVRPDIAVKGVHTRLGQGEGRGAQPLGARRTSRTTAWTGGPKAGGWAVTVRRRLHPGTRIRIAAGGLRDAHGNTAGEAAELRLGSVDAAEWPPNMGVGGGRTPGPFGEGSFPP